MQKVLAGTTVRNFNVPDNIVTHEIDAVTGDLPNEYTPITVEEIFRENNIPDNKSSLFEPVETVRIDKESGQLATNNCPPESIVEYDFFRDSGIRINTSNDYLYFEFEEINDELDIENSISGVYRVPPDHPVQKIDPETGVPATTVEGNPIFETKPDEDCYLHKDDVSDRSGFFDELWRYFNN